jgi:very-long-chain enoyl-CoA reductase
MILKFLTRKSLPSRVGMTLIYGLPLVALWAGGSPYLSSPNAYQLVVLACLCVHFVKRLLESWFLHKYSGPMHPITAVGIACFYSLTTFFPAWFNRQPVGDIDPLVYAGLGLFFIGESLNFFHHKILADLRQTSMAYVVPRGGLFDSVACPHYLFEIVSWFGLTLIFRHDSMLLFFLLMVAYLIIRSLFTLKWYREQFPDFPPGRKAIFPYLL